MLQKFIDGVDIGVGLLKTLDLGHVVREKGGYGETWRSVEL